MTRPDSRALEAQLRIAAGIRSDFDAHLMARAADELARLREDRDRLDWLESKVQHLPPAQGAPATEAMPTVFFEPGQSLREGIDRARGAHVG